MTVPTTTRWVTTTRPPPIEALGKVYFTPLMDPLPVTTRTPQTPPSEETPTAFLRLQSGGGRQRPDWYLWDVTLILHSYAPNDQEVLAEDNLGIAQAWGANAQGTSIVLKNGDSYYVTYSHATGLQTRQGDPYVDMIRYRSMVLWRVQGLVLAAS